MSGMISAYGALLSALFSDLGAIAVHGDAGYWDEIILYGGGILLLTLVFFGLLLSRRLKPDIDDQSDDSADHAGK